MFVCSMGAQLDWIISPFPEIWLHQFHFHPSQLEAVKRLSSFMKTYRISRGTVNNRKHSPNSSVLEANKLIMFKRIKV